VRLNSSPGEPIADDVVRATRVWYDQEALGYDERTSSYDRFPGLIEEISRFAAGLTISTGPVLDLGCGTGRDTEFLLDKGFPVTSADISAAMLRATMIRCGRARVQPVQLDMRELPFRTNSLRGAWVCASLVHLPPSAVPIVLSELHRVTRTGGKVAISMKRKEGTREGAWVRAAHTHGRRWFTYVDSENFTRLLSESGFANCASTASGRGSWFIASATKS
jgi:ubiquinone/menaquinone biosynthesis C-methylase UbiE